MSGGIGMKSLVGAVVTVAAVVAASVSPPSAGAAGCTPSITTLPDLGYGSSALAVHGDTVVGSVLTASRRQDAAYWRDGRLYLPELTRGYVGDLNPSGEMVGNAHRFTEPFAIVDGIVHPLAYTGGSGYARRINNRGQIAGASEDSNVAARWDSYDAQPVLLGPAPGHTFSFAKGINDVGEVAGDSDDENFVPYSAIWDRFGGVRLLPSALEVGGPGDLFAINDQGQSTGESYAGGAYGPTADQATLWSAKGVPTLIPFLPGANLSVGLELNDRGWVVGTDVIGFDYTTGDDAGHHGFIWFGGGAAATLPVPGLAYEASESDVHYVANDGTAVGSSGPAGGPDTATVWSCAQSQAFVPAAHAAPRVAAPTFASPLERLVQRRVTYRPIRALR